MDRNVHRFDLWHMAHARRFDLLIRVQNGPARPVEKVLSTAAPQSRSPKHATRTESGVVVRVIRYGGTEANGKVHESRRVTSVLDAQTKPAAELMERYHTRWEEELAFGEVKKPLGARVTHIRALDPLRAFGRVGWLRRVTG